MSQNLIHAPASLSQGRDMILVSPISPKHTPIFYPGVLNIRKTLYNQRYLQRAAHSAVISADGYKYREGPSYEFLVLEIN